MVVPTPCQDVFSDYLNPSGPQLEPVSSASGQSTYGVRTELTGDCHSKYVGRQLNLNYNFGHKAFCISV